VTQKNPWSGAGDSTRQEVRDIFARHAASATATTTGTPPERRAPLPNLFKLPAAVWRVLPPAAKALVALVLVAAAVTLALLIPPALDNASENRVNQRRAAAANLERIRLRLVEDQRPRRATLSLPAGAAPAAVARTLAPEVTADARGRVAAGKLEGPIAATTCRPVLGRQPGAGALVLTCLVQRGEQVGIYRGRALVRGYRFRGRVNLATGAAAWCKENPRPLHPDQEEFVVVPLSRACTG
jgi:hypothetical protein